MADTRKIHVPDAQGKEHPHRVAGATSVGAIALGLLVEAGDQHLRTALRDVEQAERRAMEELARG